MTNFLINIITLGLKPLYEKNIGYYKLIKDFRIKLPRLQNQARHITDDEKNMHFESVKYLTVLNVSSQKVNMSESDIDCFYNNLTDFDYRFVFFKNYYKNYTSNLNRFNPRVENSDFDLAVVQIILKDNPQYPLKPLNILMFHLKWKWKISAKIYGFFSKKK